MLLDCSWRTFITADTLSAWKVRLGDFWHQIRLFSFLFISSPLTLSMQSLAFTIFLFVPLWYLVKKPLSVSFASSIFSFDSKVFLFSKLGGYETKTFSWITNKLSLAWGVRRNKVFEIGEELFVDTLINKTFNYSEECFKHLAKLREEWGAERRRTFRCLNISTNLETEIYFVVTILCCQFYFCFLRSLTLVR